MDPNADMQMQSFSINNIRTDAWTFFQSHDFDGIFVI